MSSHNSGKAKTKPFYVKFKFTHLSLHFGGMILKINTTNAKAGMTDRSKILSLTMSVYHLQKIPKKMSVAL